MNSIGAVVLAAGASTRMGSPKQLILHEGVPLVRWAAIAAVDAGATPVIVVLGANANLIAPVLAGLPGVAAVVNAEWEQGIASSLATGLRAVGVTPGLDGVMVTLADQPLVDAAVLKKLMTVFDQRHRIVASSYDGVIGVPAIFGSEHMEELAQLQGDTGAAQWLRTRAAQVTSVPVAAGIVDIDTPEDAARLCWNGPRSGRK